MKLFLSFIICTCSIIGKSQNNATSDTSAYKGSRWLDGFHIDLNVVPASQRELMRRVTPFGKRIEETQVNNTLFFSANINYRNNFFAIGTESFSSYLNGFSIGGNVLFWNWMTPEIDILPTFRYGWSKPGRFDNSSNPYWAVGVDFYIDNIHIGFTQLNRSTGNDQPNVLKRSNLLLLIGYSFNRKSFRKKQD